MVQHLSVSLFLRLIEVSTKIFYVKINLYQLFGVGALAHRGLLPVKGLVWEVPLAFPAPHHSAREGCPGHCGTLTGLGGNSGLQVLYVRSIGTLGLDHRKNVGVTTLDVVMTNKLTYNLTHSCIKDALIPVIGGHAGVTILPLFS